MEARLTEQVKCGCQPMRGKLQYPRPFSALRSSRGIKPEAKWNRVFNAFAPLGAEAISVDSAGWRLWRGIAGKAHTIREIFQIRSIYV